MTRRHRAALFDLDRTLVRLETASLYMRYQREMGEASAAELARVLWWVGQYTLGLLDVEAVAEKALAGLRGTTETVMSARCDDWVRRYVERHITDEGRKAVEQHRADGALLAIVTGASPYVARPVARRLGIPHVVATELELEGERFTGRAMRPLCYGEGKVVKAKKLASEQGFELGEAIFYSDSYTDLPLLLAVGEPVVVNPDPRLRREASRRGWRVERW